MWHRYKNLLTNKLWTLNSVNVGSNEEEAYIRLNTTYDDNNFTFSWQMQISCFYYLQGTTEIMF